MSASARMSVQLNHDIICLNMGAYLNFQDSYGHLLW